MVRRKIADPSLLGFRVQISMQAVVQLEHAFEKVV